MLTCTFPTVPPLLYASQNSPARPASRSGNRLDILEEAAEEITYGIPGRVKSELKIGALNAPSVG